MIIRTALMVSTALAAMAVPGIANAAQEQAAPVDPSTVNPDPAAANSAPDSEDAGPDVIVVTAQKRTQVLIDVPQSITVISGATLETQQANSFADYLKLVPGLQHRPKRPGQGRLILRGLNTVASHRRSRLHGQTPFGSSTGLVNAASSLAISILSTLPGSKSSRAAGHAFGATRWGACEVRNQCS